MGQEDQVALSIEGRMKALGLAVDGRHHFCRGGSANATGKIAAGKDDGNRIAAVHRDIDTRPLGHGAEHRVFGHDVAARFQAHRRAGNKATDALQHGERGVEAESSIAIRAVHAERIGPSPGDLQTRGRAGDAAGQHQALIRGDTGPHGSGLFIDGRSHIAGCGVVDVRKVGVAKRDGDRCRAAIDGDL